MSFTRIHYKAIAKVMKESDHRREVLEGLIELFKSDNNRFDENKFREACLLPN